MGETSRTTDERDDAEGLGPEERLRAAARILARGIRRLLTSPPPPIAAAKTRFPTQEDQVEPLAQPVQRTENTEKAALPVVPSRALMTRTRSG